MKRKLLVLLLTLALAALALPMAAFAEGYTDQASLQEALNAAGSSGVVDMGGAVVDLTGPALEIPAGVTLQNGELNTDATPIVMKSGSKLFNLDIHKTTSADLNIVQIAENDATVENVDFDGMYVLGGGETTRGVVPNAGISGYLIKGCTFKGLRQPGYLEGQGTVENCYAEGTRGWVVTQNHEVTFTNCTFSGNADNNTCNICIIENGSTPNVYTAEKLKALSADNPGAYIIQQPMKVALVDGVCPVYSRDGASGDGLTDLQRYASLNGALALGGSVSLKMEADVTADVVIPAGTTVALNLNGHKITNAGDHTIVNNGTLTITDTSTGKTGTVDNITHGKAAVYNKIGATATLNGGTFTRSLEAGDLNSGNDNSWYTLCNLGTMSINSGASVENKGSFSSMIENGFYSQSVYQTGAVATLTINGGNFTGGLNSIKNDSYGTLVINDGTFKNTAQAVVLNWNQTEIKGGNFVLEGSDAVTCLLNGIYSPSVSDDCKGVLKVSGGSFTAPQGVPCVVNNFTDEKPLVTGGTYSEKPDSSFVVPGYKFSGNSVVADPWEPLPTATPAPGAAAAGVLDSTPKTGDVSFGALALAGLAFAALGVAAKRKLH